METVLLVKDDSLPSGGVLFVDVMLFWGKYLDKDDKLKSVLLYNF